MQRLLRLVSGKPLCLLLLASSAVAGCGSSSRDETDDFENDGGAGSGDAGADSGSDSGIDDACPGDCAAAALQSSSQEPWECDAAQPLCDPIDFEAPPGFSITTADAVSTVESARCALRALREGREGLVSWSASARSSPGVSLSTTLFIRPERVVLSAKFRAADITTMTSYGYARLQDPAHFENCEQQSDPAALFDCLQRADEASCSGP